MGVTCGVVQDVASPRPPAEIPSPLSCGALSVHYDGNTRLVCLTALTHEPDIVSVTCRAVGCLVVGLSCTVIGMEFGLGMTNLADPIVGRRIAIIETVGTAAGGEGHRPAVDFGVDQREVRSVGIVRIMAILTN